MGVKIENLTFQTINFLLFSPLPELVRNAPGFLQFSFSRHAVSPLRELAACGKCYACGEQKRNLVHFLVISQKMVDGIQGCCVPLHRWNSAQWERDTFNQTVDGIRSQAYWGGGEERGAPPMLVIFISPTWNCHRCFKQNISFGWNDKILSSGPKYLGSKLCLCQLLAESPWINCVTSVSQLLIYKIIDE